MLRLISALFISCLLLTGCERISDALSVALTPADQQGRMAQVLERGELRVATLYGSSSYFVDRDGNLQGFDYELATAFAQYLGVKLKVKAVYTTHELLTLSERGGIDLLTVGLSPSSLRHGHFRYAPPYQRVDQIVVYKQGRKRPRNLGELNGTLEVAANSSAVASLQQLKQSYPDLTWQENSELQSEELLARVARGELDHTIIDSARFANFRRYQPDLEIAFVLNSDQPQGWLLPSENDDSLYAALIEFFGQSQESGLLATLDEKYFGHLTRFDYGDIKYFMAAVESRLPRYRPLFEELAGDLDWRLIAAISYKESSWLEDARSPTGVEGLMMLTNNTAQSLGITNRRDPRQSIDGGVRYIHKMLDLVPAEVTADEHLWFALVAYNIGIGHLQDAMRVSQKRGAQPHSWADLKASLPLLANPQWSRHTRLGFVRGDSAVRYVDAIRRYYDILVYIDDRAAQAAAMDAQREKFNRLGSPAIAGASSLDAALIAEIEASRDLPVDDDPAIVDAP